MFCVLTLSLRQYQKQKHMTYSFYIAYPDRATSAITIAIRNKNKRITISSGVIINPADWDAANNKIKKSADDYKLKQTSLLQFENKVREVLNVAEHNGYSLDQVKEALTGQKTSTRQKIKRGDNYISFLDFFGYWAENRINDHTPRRQHRQSYNLLKEFDSSIDYNDVNYRFYTEFITWCRSAKKYKENTTGTHIRNIKSVMNEALKRGYHTNTAFQNFSKPKEEADTVYLSNKEIDKLYHLPLTGQQASVRDCFLIGCYTALRFSDYASITMWDVSQGYIVKRTQKTQASVTIPIHPRVKEILTKYNGAPSINISTLNKLIKPICMAAGIREKVAVTSNRVTEYKEKWELVSSHTARRTGATNMFLAGIPTISIMKITGHKSEKVFLNYIKITNLENAKLIKNNKFFTGK